MSYEEAPATALLATHCCACGRALLDAESVERGIGPVCAEKFGFLVPVGAAERAEANKLVHAVAALAGACSTEVSADVEAALARLLELGFVKLAGIIRLRLAGKADVVVEVEGGFYVVRAPYSPAFLEAAGKFGRTHWEFVKKHGSGRKNVRLVPVGERNRLWLALKHAFPGAKVAGPAGAVIIGGEESGS
jgi:hypothetical protein